MPSYKYKIDSSALPFQNYYKSRCVYLNIKIILEDEFFVFIE